MMKLLLIIANVLWISVLMCNSQHVTLIGSHLLPIESDYKVHLSAQDLTENSILNVSMKSGENHESFKIFENIKGDLNEEIDFELPNETLPYYKLNIVHKNKATNACIKQSVKINDIPNRHMIFIQLDKPVYRNKDTIKFITFVMDHKTVPLNSIKMDVTIFDGKGNAIRKFENVEASTFGVYENYLKIGELINYGTWKIQVKVDGKKKSKNFQVIKHKESSFEVLVDTQKEVAFVDKKLFLNIQVKSPNDRIFTGIAKISSTVRFKDSNHVSINRFVKTLDIPNDKKVITLDLNDDLGILNPTADLMIGLDIEVIEDRTKKSEKVTVEIPMRHKGRNNLILTKNHYFKPGFDYSVKIKAKDLNGRPDASLSPLTMNIDYENFDKNTRKSSVDRKSFVLSLKNGEIDVTLHSTENTKKMKLHLELAGTEHREDIESLPNHGVEEYLQATILNKSQNVGDTIQISVQSSNEFETLHLLVIGPYGVVYTKDYPDAKGRDMFELSLELTQEMRPESHVIVFYVRREDGVVIHDEFGLSLGYSADNYLEISAPQTAKPDQTVKVDIKSANGSLVYLTAVDQNSALISRDNKISRSNMYNEIVHYMNQKFNNVSVYQFDRFNAFVMQPLTAGSSCDEIDEISFDDITDDEFEPAFTEKLAQKYFPDVWFDEIIDVTSNEVQSIVKELPDDFTSWRIYGTSIHPTKGFAVAKKEAKISVNREIAIIAHTPATLYSDEVLKVEFSVFNFLKTPQNVHIDVVIDNANLMSENIETKSGKKCKTYNDENYFEFLIEQQIPAGSMSKPQHFFVKPSDFNVIEIIITANAGNYKDEVHKIIRLQGKQEETKTVQAAYLIQLKDGETFEKDIILTIPEDAEFIDAKATFSGQLVDYLDDFVEEFVKPPKGYIEQKIEHFNFFLILSNFLYETDQDIPSTYVEDLLIGYQTVIAFLQFPNITDDPLSTVWMHSFAVSAAIDFKEYFYVDDVEIEKALDYLKSEQHSDGSFKDEPVAYVRREMGTQQAQSFILTAKIALTFLKYQKYSNKYEEVIPKALNFLKSSKDDLANDYEKVIVAYTLAVSSNHETSKFLTSSMKNLFLKPPKHKKHMSMFVEIASYLTMTKMINNEDPKVEIEWLLNQQHPDGRFYSTYDTLLAFEALLKFSASKNPKNTELDFSLYEDGNDNYDDDLRKYIFENDVTTTSIKRKHQYKLKVTGHGIGFAKVSYKYSTKQHKNSMENFSINVKTTDIGNNSLEIEVDVKLIAEGIRTTNLVMIEVEMPRGYQYNGHNTEAKYIEMFEHKNDRTLALFYIDIMEVNMLYKEVIQAAKVFEIEYPATSTIRVYDYYQTNVRDEIEYKFDSNSKDCEEIVEEKSKEKESKKKGNWWG